MRIIIKFVPAIWRNTFIMKKLRRFLIFIITAVFPFVLMTGCGGNSFKTSGKLSVVTTIFPEYDWVMQILGDKADDAEVTMLLDNGVDLHSFQPSVEDIARIASCDVFIYVGGDSESWVDNALEYSKNPQRKVINLFDELGDSVREEESVEGMQPEHEHGHEHEDEPEYDEHIWLSLRNAQVLVNSICGYLCDADKANAQTYKANAENYIQKLAQLDRQYQDTVNSAEYDTLLFGDRFPFRYLTDDYGIRYYAAFAGCSAETEASFKTITFLAGKLDELGLPAVITIDNADHRVADTIIHSTQKKKQKILSLNSMQSVTSDDIKKGETYYSVMEKNLDVIKEALD